MVQIAVIAFYIEMQHYHLNKPIIQQTLDSQSVYTNQDLRYKSITFVSYFKV